MEDDFADESDFVAPSTDFDAVSEEDDQRSAILKGFVGTFVLGVAFVGVQLFEFCYADFAINDSVYGSIFFFLTGFHGFHVIVGLIFLFIIFIRISKYHLYAEEHTVFELAI